MRYFLQSIPKPAIRFEILGHNKETGMMRLKGQYAEFEEKMNKDLMTKYKYTIVKEDSNANTVQPPV